MTENTTPRWQRRGTILQGAVLLLVLLWGAGQALFALTRPEIRTRLAASLTPQALVQGHAAQAVNDALARHLPADADLRAAGALVRWQVFGAAGPKLRAGCNDMLFLTEELQPWHNAEAHMAARADALARLRARVAPMGVQILPVLVPDKADIEAQSLCGIPRAQQAKARYGEFLAMLRARGVPAVDLAPPMEAARADGHAIFYRADSHWNQRGARIAAESTAAAAQPVPLDRSARFATLRAAQESEAPDDLLRVMSLDRVPDLLRPPADRVRKETTIPITSLPPSQVVLLGSSFSRHADFAGQLQQAMHTPVENRSMIGGAFFRAAGAYFSSPEFIAEKPRLVVWEIPTRVVQEPLSLEEQRYLSLW